MTTIDEISKTIIVLIRIGVIFRVAFCFLKMTTADDEAPQLKKRIKHAILFYILAEMAWIIRDMATNYYG